MATRYARLVAVAALLIGYPVLMHHANAQASIEPGGLGAQIGALLAVAPLLLVAVVLAWRSRAGATRFLLYCLVGAACAGLWALWPLLMRHFDSVYWLQHAGMYWMLGMWFGRTLLSGQTPICTQFARVVHAPLELSPRHVHYTRQVTVAWTVFFALIAVLSTVLYFFAPLEWWSVFANFVTLPLVILMFVIEYAARSFALPDVPPVHIFESVRAFMSHGARKA